MELNFSAFDFTTPRLTLSSSIGNGVSLVSKFLTTKLNGNPQTAQPLVDYLVSLNHQGEVRIQLISGFNSNKRNELVMGFFFNWDSNCEDTDDN